MAVVIASNLRKELAGAVLFDGVSFSVERRDRVEARARIDVAAIRNDDAVGV